MVFSAIIIIFLYQNCTNKEKIVVDPNSDRVVHTMNEALTTQSVSSICEPQENYFCVNRVYSPGVLSDDLSDIECVEIDSTQYCVVVLTVITNTDLKMTKCRDCKPEDFQPGGRFNRQEYTCQVASVMKAASYPFQGVGLTLLEALQPARDLCLQAFSDK